jgi:hypothetical protein
MSRSLLLYVYSEENGGLKMLNPMLLSGIPWMTSQQSPL